MSSVRRKLSTAEDRGLALSKALDDGEKRHAARELSCAETQRVMEQQYDYLVKEYEERIRDLDYDRKKREEEVNENTYHFFYDNSKRNVLFVAGKYSSR